MANFKDLTEIRIDIKNMIDSTNAKLSDLKKDLERVDQQILEHMEAEGQELARANGYTFSVRKQELFTATDWTLFGEFVENNKCSHLFQRRLTQKAVEEAVNLFGDDVPVETYTKVSLGARKV